MHKATFFSKLERLPSMLEWVRSHLSAIPAKEAHKIEVAAEEVLVNIIHYAYPKKEGKIEICLKGSVDAIHIEIHDWGCPFNPLEQGPSVDVGAPAEEREPGGLGIYLIQQIMDEVSYRRDGDANVLILLKRSSRKS
jgi:anti-sigma regulatory factor (Ser/Thr protein kinase)